MVILPKSMVNLRRRARASLGLRMALVMGGMAIATATFLAILSFLVAQRLIEDNRRAAFAFQIDVVSHQITFEARALEGMLRGMARNAFVSNALVDSLGRDRYLIPYLRDQPLPGAWQGEVWLVNFEGEPIAGNVRGARFAYADSAALRAALADGRLRVELAHEHVLLVVAPVVFPPTGSIEGAIVAVLDHRDALASSASLAVAGSCLVVRMGERETPIPERCEPAPGALAIVRPLDLPASYRALQPEIRAYVSLGNVSGDAVRLALAYGAVVGAVVLVVLFFSRRIAKRIVGPLARLTATADEIVSKERLDLRAPVAGADEIGRLATAFNHMVAALQAVQARLIEDLDARKRIEQALFEEKERAEVTLHSIGDAVITTDGEAIVSYLNPVAETLTGWSTAEARGRILHEVFRIIDEQTRQPAPDPVARCLAEGRIVGLANHTVLIARHGVEYHIDDSVAPIRGRDGHVLGAVLVFHDVTETRRLTLQLEHDATHDALTGLINRPEFERRVLRALASAQHYAARHALCYLDLDQFKLVNDTAGHAAGDELLRQINTILAGMFRERDTLARIGGDEFGLLLNNCPLERAQRIAQAVVDSIRRHRFDWKGRRYQIGASVGVVAITGDAQDGAQLLTQADVACYIAKELGRNRVHVYQQEDAETTQRHGEILGATGLRDALEQGRFRLYYQPIMPLHGAPEQPARYEALLRVACDERAGTTRELVMPAAFIPAAERYGLMTAIDRWVIATAFREFAGGVGPTGAMVAINLSGNSLSDETLLPYIEQQFATHALPPERVCFEVTETAAIQKLHGAQHLMTTLKRRGSQFALDDFGSGLSSFHYLKTLPIDYLKIDGSFVKDMLDSSSDCALVAAITQMSHTLGIQTVAEYAHSGEIVDRLRTLGVDYAQGYYFGQPVSGDALFS